MFKKITELFHRYERHLSSGALVVGFIIDSLTLRRVDLLIENLALVGYILIIATSIIVLNLIEIKKLAGGMWDKLQPWFLIAMQFAIGGLFSAFLVFYSRSASVVASWPFLLLIVGLMIANEMLRDRYARLTFQIGVFFFGLFSYSIFVVPVIIKHMGWWVFLISGFLSLALIFVFIKILQKLSPERFAESKKMILISIGCIYIMLNIFYFTNIIPPIPLSMQEAGIYTGVIRMTSSYELVGKGKEFSPGQTLYAYTSIFAPTSLDTQIIHEWQYFDPGRARWVEAGRISFPITGGRDGGYRGYSLKENISKGKWRVNVETSEGKLVGRIKFEVK